MAHDVTYVFTQKDKVQQERGALADMVALLTYVQYNRTQQKEKNGNGYFQKTISASSNMEAEMTNSKNYGTAVKNMYHKGE